MHFLNKKNLVFCSSQYLIFLHSPSQNISGCLRACLYNCVPSLQIPFGCTVRKAKVQVVINVFLDYRLEPTLCCQVVEEIEVSYFSATTTNLFTPASYPSPPSPSPPFPPPGVRGVVCGTDKIRKTWFYTVIHCLWN